MCVDADGYGSVLKNWMTDSEGCYALELSASYPSLHKQLQESLITSVQHGGTSNKNEGWTENKAQLATQHTSMLRCQGIAMRLLVVMH